MGRSQVKYNQRNGRPGQKGRGGGGREGRGGGRGSSSTDSDDINKRPPARAAKTNLGDNTWRYQQDDEDVTEESKLDEQLLALESHGNYANQVSATEEDDGNIGGSSTTSIITLINVVRMQEALTTVSLGDILRLPPYLTASLEHQSRPVIGLAKKQTLRDNEKRIEATPAAKCDAPPTPEKLQQDNQEDAIVEEEAEEENDMESWLDSVIS
mmetsp:Transcript_12388/g.20529  ORF Transcript_12388/g.20529 Transcript_12388/m.20529 type:complete len:212 (-) Transcript_12388:53-688(-)